MSGALARAAIGVLAGTVFCGAVPANAESAKAVDLSALEEMSLEDILNMTVVSTTKTAMSRAKAPGVVTVITHADIQRWGYRSLAQVLQHIAGFNVIDDHVVPNVSLRGIAGGYLGESSQLKVLIDGRAVAFRTTEGNWLGPELIPLAAVDRIEILSGPASALYGSNAFVGVVSIITRRAQKDQSWLDVNFGLAQVGANFGGYDVDTAVGGNLGDFTYLVGARLAREDRSGVPIPASSPAPVIPSYVSNKEYGQGLEMESVAAILQVSYAINDRTEISISPYYSGISRGNDFIPAQTLSHGTDSQGRDRGGITELRQGSLAVAFRSELVDGLTLSANTTGFIGGPGANDLSDPSSFPFPLERRFSYMGQDTVLQVGWQIIDTLQIVGGSELNLDQEQAIRYDQIALSDVDDVQAGQVLTPSPLADRSVLLTNIAGYIQAIWAPLDPYLQITGGARLDHHSIYGYQPSGRLALVSQPADTWSLKLMYGTAFKAPSALMLFAETIGDPDLRPQRVHTAELETSFSPHPMVSLTNCVSYNHLFDVVGFTLESQRIIRPYNQATLRVFAVESTARFSWGERLGSYLSYSLALGSRDLSGLDPSTIERIDRGLPSHPTHIVQAGLYGVVPYLDLRMAAQAVLVGRRQATDSNSYLNGQPYFLGEYVMLDANIRSPTFTVFAEHESSISLKGSNLLGAIGPQAGLYGVDYPLPPRTFLLSWHQEI